MMVCGLSSFHGVSVSGHECFADEEVEIADDHSESLQFQDRLKDQCEELIEINFVEEVKVV